MITSSEIPVLPNESLDDGFNGATRIATVSSMLAAHGMTPKLVFLHHWRSLRARLDGRDEPGLALFVIDEAGGVVAHDWIHGKPRVTHRILGRHRMCDLRSTRETLALRHLAIMVRLGEAGAVGFRVRDLFTSTGFSDEADRTLYGLDADGPLLLRAGGVHVIVLKTPFSDLPEDPDAAWSLLPERIFTEGVTDTARPRPRVASRAPRGDPEHTNVTGVSGPLGVEVAEPLVADDETPAGVITLRAGATAARCEIGASALARGVLIGRYDRCALGASWGGAQSPLSRVHLLLHRWGEELLAFDTSSTNGTWRGDQEHRRYLVEDGLVLKLSEQVQLVWHDA